jgi:predicted small metal-binding protein
VTVDRVLTCDCGFEARGEDEEALVDQVMRHAREAHGMALSHDEALAVARDKSSIDQEGNDEA